jgi:cobalt-zinc-cadmium efflux system outer membrane protein
MKRASALMLLALPAIAGCRAYQYRPAPASPPDLAHRLEARSLDDPALHAWMENAAHFQPGSWPLQSWDLRTLTLAAWYFNPDLDIARAQVAAAGAAIRTAVMKPNPSVSIGPGYESAPESPFMMAFDLSVPIETAGKRGYRVAVAQHESEASRLQLAETGWTVRSRVRAAWISYILAARIAGLLQQQVSLQTRYADLLQERFRAGEISLPDTTTAQIDLTNLRQVLRSAEGQVGIAHAALAAAIGIPDSALAGKTITWPGAGSPPSPPQLPPPQVREKAVLNRLDVQRALAYYKAAQSSLQLEIARQYPDVELGPGYAFEEGYQLISLNLSAVLPVRNRNQGPIAEAEALRKLAGAQLLAVQSTVIADTDRALAQYRAAWATLAEARRSEGQVDSQYHAAEQALTAGETDQLTVLAAELQQKIVERSTADALLQTQVSLGALEDALQRPIDPAAAPVLPSQEPRAEERIP